MGVLDYLRRRRPPVTSPFNPDDEETAELLRRAAMAVQDPAMVRPRVAARHGRSMAELPPPLTEPLPTEAAIRPRRTGVIAPTDLGMGSIYDSTNEAVRERGLPEAWTPESRELYRGQVEAMPVKKNRLKSVGQGILQAIATAGPNDNLGSLLGRAIGGAGAGALYPKLHGEVKRDRELAKVDQEIARDLGIRKVTQGLDEQQADIALKRIRPQIDIAKAESLDRNRERTRDEVERHNQVMERFQGDTAEDRRERAEEIKRHNREMEEIRRTEAEALGARFETTTDQKETAQQEGTYNRRETEAKGYFDKMEKANTDADFFFNEATRLSKEAEAATDAATKQKLMAAAQAAQNKAVANNRVANSAASALSAFGDIYEIGGGKDTRGLVWPSASRKQRPEFKSPQRERTTQKYTEAEVRRRARRQGVDPDEAVRNARAKGLIK